MSSPEHANVLAALPILRQAIAARQPFSMIRLGDGEGRLLGFPEFVSAEELGFSLNIWFGREDFPPAELAALAISLREAVKAADIVGLPRPSQEDVPEWRAILKPVERFDLLAHGPVLTDTAIHRYLQIGLFYRELLDRLPFCGIISCRDLAPRLSSVFRIEEIRQYLVPGEVKYPGPMTGEHYPARFCELRETLTVPFPGAVFLVGAGALGKIYCHWIQQRGGIALDIGSICDAWAGVGRLRKPCHSLDVYAQVPPLSRSRAIAHYNAMIARDGLRIEPLKDEALP